MSKSGKYIVYEGSEGVGKTTQVNQLVKYLREQGADVLQTKEPGTDQAPLTLELRKIILDSSFDKGDGWMKAVEKINADMVNPSLKSDLTSTADKFLKLAMKFIQEEKQITHKSRELVLQSVRSITLEKVIKPALEKYDYVIQDRGILTGFSYGEASGSNFNVMEKLNNEVVVNANMTHTWKNTYDQIILLTGNVSKGLARAQQAKAEFQAGDVMELRGTSFLDQVNNNFKKNIELFNCTKTVINVDDKDIKTVFSEILQKIV